MSKPTIPSPVLDSTLDGARREGLRLFALQRGLFAGASAGVLFVAVRGLVAIGWPAPAGAPLVAAALGVVLLATSFVFVLALRVRRRMELLARDVQTMLLARDALDGATAPRVEMHPYRATDGDDDDGPVVVVRTDSVERVFRRGRTDDARRPRSWVARATAAVVVLGALAIGAALLPGNDAAAPQRWTFLDDTTDPGGLGLKTRAGGGAWTVEPHGAATGARALVNHAASASEAPALLLAGAVRTRDVRASTRCKVGTAPGGDACGIVFRVLDEQNHHVARLDVAGRRLVIAVVSDGEERVLGETAAHVEREVWQELTLEARGDRIRASCNGRDAVEVTDLMTERLGGVGLWAPAAAEAYFDELAIEALPPVPHGLEVFLLVARGRAG